MAPQQIDPAVPTRLETLTGKDSARKVRVAGILLAYDAETNLALLAGRDLARAILVYVSICVDPGRSLPWLRDKRSLVMVTGYIEDADADLPIPTLPHRSPEPREIVDKLVLRSLLVTEAPDLDLDLWNAAIAQRERAGL